MKRAAIVVLALTTIWIPRADAGDRVREHLVPAAGLASGVEPVTVIVPAGYDDDPDKRYPVLYLWRGCCDHPDGRHQFIEQGNILEDTASDEFIIVIPEAGPVGFYTNWHNYGLGGRPAWEDAHIGAVVPWVDATFRTIPDRAHRAAAGISMGGFGSISYAARHPDLFSAAVTMSGAVDMLQRDSLIPLAAVGLIATLVTVGGDPPDSFNRIWGVRGVEDVRWRGHNPADLVTNLRDVRLAVTIGNGCSPGFDPLECTLWNQNQTFLRALDAAGIEHTDKLYAPGSHTWPYWNQRMPDFTLPFVRAHFAAPPADPASFDYRSIEPAFSVYDWTFSTSRLLPEWVSLEGVDASGFGIAGAGQWDVVTAPVYEPGSSHLVNGFAVTADTEGRLRFATFGNTSVHIS